MGYEVRESRDACPTRAAMIRRQQEIRPVKTLFVLSFGVAFLEVLADMLHPLVPGGEPCEHPIAESTNALRGRVALLMPASLAHSFKPNLEFLFRLRRRWLGWRRPWTMHATLVLREQVFAIEVVVTARAGLSGAALVGVTGTDVAAVEAELEML